MHEPHVEAVDALVYIGDNAKFFPSFFLRQQIILSAAEQAVAAKDVDLVNLGNVLVEGCRSMVAHEVCYPALEFVRDVLKKRIG